MAPDDVKLAFNLKRKQIPIVLAALAFAFLSIVLRSEAAEKTDAAARKSDLKFIKCDVCEGMAKHLTRQLKSKKYEISPKKITELHVVEIVESICDLKKDEGEWITTIDIVEEGDKLKLVEQSSPGECNSECRTVKKACDDILGDRDTDIAEAIYRNDLSRSALSQLLCRKLTKSCVGKVPPVPEDREPGEEFVAVTHEQAKLNRDMRGMDVPKSVFHDVKDEDMPDLTKYSRDDLLKTPPVIPSEKRVTDDEDEEEEERKPRKPTVKSFNKGAKLSGNFDL